MANLELEAKFWLPNLNGLRQQVIEQNATLLSPRHLERNLRLDTTDRKLTSHGEVLRLRQGARVTLTFKQPGASFEIRREWEVEVDDFQRTLGLLEGLGYSVIHIYEKYREVFKLDDCQVMLDEVPYGCFAEIEGPDVETIRSTCTQLQLNWDARIQRTYLEMFEAVIGAFEPKPRNATFAEFRELPMIDAKLLALPDGYLPESGER